MLRTLAQRGEGKAGCIFWLAVLVAFVFVSYQAIPVKVNSADLEEFITRQAESAGSASAQQIRESILARARDLDLPLSPDKLEVVKGGGRIVISCEYEAPISLAVYTYIWKFEHRIDRPVFVY